MRNKSIYKKRVRLTGPIYKKRGRVIGPFYKRRVSVAWQIYESDSQFQERAHGFEIDMNIMLYHHNDEYRAILL